MIKTGKEGTYYYMWITEQGGELMVGGMGLKGLKQGPEDVLSAVCS